MEDLHKEVNMNDRKVLLLAEQKGSSSWVSTLPIDENGFALHKGALSPEIWLATYRNAHCVLVARQMESSMP